LIANGTSGPQDKDTKRSTLGARMSDVKVARAEDRFGVWRKHHSRLPGVEYRVGQIKRGQCSFFRLSSACL